MGSIRGHSTFTYQPKYLPQALIRILVKYGVTGLFYVKKGTDSKMSSLIGRTQYKMAIIGHIMAKCDKMWI